MDSYEKATLKDEFCYRQYSNSTLDDNLGILPPLSKQEGDCTAHTLHTLVYAVEARYRKAGIWPPPLSMKDLLHNLQDMADRWGSFSLDHCSLTMGGSYVGLNSDIEPMEDEVEVTDDEEVTEEGPMDGEVEVYDEEVTDEGHQQQLGFSRIDNYTLVGKWAKETNETMKFDDVVKEIRKNGPVLATFFPDWDFSYWNMEYARNCIYEGLYFVELSEVDKKKHRGHVVTLIGFGSGEKEYFIAQNFYGLNWGDNGMFRLDPRCVRRVSVPIL